MRWRFWKGAPKPQIDRSKPFDPEKFLGEGWKIEEEDERSLALTGVGFFGVYLMSCDECGRESLTGEEKLARMKASKSEYVRLGAEIFQDLWENQWRIPRDFKFKYVFFDGTVLRSPSGLRYTLFLWWDDRRFPLDGIGERWYWDKKPLFESRGRASSSAVILQR